MDNIDDGATVSELICICCPIGCKLCAERNKDGGISVTGNTCKRGEKYAIDELTAPKRTVTTTVRLRGGVLAVAPVKTEYPIPKDKIFDVLDAVKGVELDAPVKTGDVAVRDVCGTGADVVFTRDVCAKDITEEKHE